MVIFAAMVAGLDPWAQSMRSMGAVPGASPNRLILRHVDAVFGCELVHQAAAAWSYRRGPSGAWGWAITRQEVDMTMGGPLAGPP